MAGIETLPNLGARSAAWLAASGITSVRELRRQGSVAAFSAVRSRHPRASLNLLWALEGALTGLPWQTVAREHRTSLLLALEAHERGSCGDDGGASSDSGPTRRRTRYGAGSTKGRHDR
jgi:DNA transformation protein